MAHQKTRSIQFRLTAQLLLVGVVPLLVVGGVAYATMVRSADLVGRGLDGSFQAMERDVVGANLRKTAEDVASRIDTYLEERVKDVVIWSSDPLVIEAAVRADTIARRQRNWPGYPEIAADARAIAAIEDEMKPTRALDPLPRATEYLKDQLAQSRVFREVFFTDRNGYNVGVSNPTSDFVQSDEEWWVNAWQHGVDIGSTSQNPLTAKKAPGPAFARVVFDESAGVWSVAISVRIDHPRTKQPLGVMKAVLDISAVQGLASRVAASIAGADVKVMVAATGALVADTVVEHARPYIMAKEGNLLAKGFRPAQLVSDAGGPRSGFLLGPAETHGTRPAVEQVIGYARGAGKGEFKDLPGFEGLGWAVIVGQEKQQAFAALAELARVQVALAGQRQLLPGIMLGLLAAAAAAIVAVGAVLARNISVPIRELGAAAQTLSTGNLDVEVPVRSGDEIGQLSTTFNETVVKLRSLVRTEAERDEERRRREELQRNITRFLDVSMEIARGDLTRRGEVTADVLGNVVDSINVMVDELALVIGEVRQAALQVSANASEMITTVEHLSLGAQSQAREAVGVSASVDDLTGSVRRVAEHAEASATAARLTLEAAQKGEEAVRGSLAGMQRIRAEVQGIAKKVKGLADRSLEISEILGTIEEIAAQTNLVALNAAIEAAGAGEAGVRFAVVADEVRKLADRSARAARDIEAVVKTIQAETQEAVVAMEDGTREVEAGHHVTVQTGDRLREIGEFSQRSAGLAGDISQATHQQVRTVESTAAAVQAIASIAVETDKGMAEARRTMDQLVRLADALTTNLSRFKLQA
jgi:methyl-accepting chemotaxis protein